MQSIDFAEFTARTLELYATGRHARKTYLRMSQVLRELLALGLRSTADLTTQNMARYVSSKGPGANANTMNGMLAAVASACSYALEEGWLDRSPAWRRIRLRETPCIQNRPRSYEEICRLLDHLYSFRERSWELRRICALVWFVSLTGVRLGEAQFGCLEDLDLAEANPSFHVNPLRHRLKTLRSERRVPLAEVLITVLADWLPHSGPHWIFPGVKRLGPWIGGTHGRSKCGDHLKRAAAEVGIDRMTWHSLRHAFARDALVRWEVPMWIVQRVLGHTDIRTTQRYLDTAGSPEIARAIRGIGYRPTG